MNKIGCILVCWLFCIFNSIFAQQAVSLKNGIETSNLNTILRTALRKYLPLALAWEDAGVEQSATTAKNLIVITTDGVRWQEVFGGAAGKTREQLMPFFWKKLAPQAQVYGNRWLGSGVRVSNRMHISYPGYSEIICGFADDQRVKFNKAKNNPNFHVFEWLNQQRGYRNRVAAVGSWHLFSFIFNEKRAKMEVNAGFEKLVRRTDQPFSAKQNELNECLENSAKPWKHHLRPDSLTWLFAQYQIKTQHPRVLFIGFGETDEYAHEGNFEGYLQAISRFDSLLAAVWQVVESDEFYRGCTALLVTTDHGRGRKNWRSHHPFNEGSDETWLAVFSPDIVARGEISQPTDLRAEQFAATMSQLIGLAFRNPARAIAPAPEIIFQENENSTPFKLPATVQNFSETPISSTKK